MALWNFVRKVCPQTQQQMLSHLAFYLVFWFSLSNAQSQKFQQPDKPELIYSPTTIYRYIHNEPGSFFGYSVSAYVGQSQPFCLVGAPKANHDPLGDTSPGMESTWLNQTSRTGAVYRIELDPKLPYCSIVPVATSDELRREHGTPTPGFSTWLGGSVASASNTANSIQLACDPRYVYAPDPMNQTAWDGGKPADSTYHARTYVGTGHCALYTGASMRYTSVDSCVSQVEGSCLAGHSADVEAGQQFGEAFVALGMPGSYLTEGNVFLGHYRGQEVLSALRLKNSPQDLKHTGFNLGFAVSLSKLVRPNKQQPTAQSQSSNDLSTRSKFSDKWSVLASSSMWIDNDYRGIVMILDQALDLGGVTYLKDHWGHVGSFFGYSLTTADLDGNGLADVIVGAPYFTEKKQEETDQDNPLQGSSSNNLQSARDISKDDESSDSTSNNMDANWGRLSPDIGRVYIFYGHRRNTSTSPTLSRELEQPDYLSHEPVILSGFKSIAGRFGHAVVNLGDVDSDGTDDLAVSCPFCSDPEGRKDKGAVLIYLGRKGEFLEDSPFQVIWPADFPHTAPTATCGNFGGDDQPVTRPFRSFGWSLSGGADLDGNHVPDLVVGDFDTDQVVMLRARNTIWFDSPEWNIPVGRTLPWSKPGQESCGRDCHFPVHLSIAVHGNPDHLREQTGQCKLRVMIDLDSKVNTFWSKRLVGRNNLNPVETNQPQLGMIKTEVPLIIDTASTLNSHRISLLSLILEPQAHHIRALLWSPLVINVSVAPAIESEDDLDSIVPWGLHPFLGLRHFQSRELYFANPECGPDHICHSDLQVRMVDSSEGLVDNLVVYFRERTTQRNLTVGIGNLGENAYAAQLRMTFPNQFSFTIPKYLNCRIEILQVEHATQLLCELGDPIGYTGMDLRPIIFQLNTAGAFRDLNEPMNDEPAESNLNDSRAKSDEMTSKGNRGRFKRTPSKPDEVTITAEVISGNTDTDMENNFATISYKLQLASKIELSSSSVDRTTIDSRNFTVQLYEMQRVHPETIGPEIKHVYLVSNDGPSPMANLVVNVSMPVLTEKGEYLVYFVDGIRYQAEDGGPPLVAKVIPEVVSAEGHTRGTCNIPDWAVNPLRLNAVDRGQATSIPSANHVRRTRSVESESLTQQSTSITIASPRNTRDVSTSGRRRQQDIIRCDHELADLGKPICVTITCKIDQLSRGDAVRIVIRGYVWADTFFRHKIADLAVVSEASSELPTTVFGIQVHGNRTVQPLRISQNFVFNGIKVPLFREIPLWPIILGCLLGVALLAIIILGMWRCGFFRRKRWYDTRQPNSLSISPAEL